MKFFIALRRRWYRWFLGGRGLSSGAFRIRDVARNWLVYSLTGSALALGWVDAAWGVATFLLSLFGGAASDRVGRRRLLVLGQIGVALIPLVVTFLIFGGVIQVWHLVVANFIMGVVFAFVVPARHALLGDLMSPEVLLNAMALSTIVTSVAQIASSAMGGKLVDEAGPVPAYLLVAGCMALTAWMFSKLPSTKEEGDEQESEDSIRDDLAEGANYILDKPLLVGILALELGQVLFYRPHSILLPFFAGDVFEVGATGLGLLQGASSVGGLLGSLIIASLGDFRYKGWLLIGAGILSGVGLLFLGWAPTFFLALISLALATMGGSAYTVTRITLLQSISSKQMRGRVVGFRRLIWGMRPLGVLPVGALADAVGAPLTVTLTGGVILLLFVVGSLLQPGLRRH
ncbi:MAG: MFS transporter [Anaerolineales bacterium]